MEDNNIIDPKSITEEEENAILADLEENASIEYINDVIYQIRKPFYEQKPVDIHTFITDSYYLGESTKGFLYPIWYKTLCHIHASPFVNNYYEIILEAPLGSGKSWVACISILYEIYKLLCLRDPQAFYGLGVGTQIYFTIFSVNFESVYINWGYLRSLMENSKFFKDLSKIVKVSKGQQLGFNQQQVFKDIFINLGSSPSNSISKAIFGGMMDEGNFQDRINNQAYENYDALTNRIESRFADSQGTPPGILWLVSSPTLESAFTSTRMEASKGNDSTLILENITKWNLLKGTDKYKKTYQSNMFFHVFTGNASTDPFIIDPDSVLAYPDELVLKVPMEHFNLFSKNPKKALRDTGGRRITVTGSFFETKDSVKKLMTIPNKFITPVDERFLSISENVLNNTGTGIIKTGMKNKTNLIKLIADEDYFKNPMFPYSHRVIHIDIGAKKDRCGIASSFAIYRDEQFYKTFEKYEERSSRMYYNEWAIALEAYEGDEIPFSTIVDLLVYLKSIGYPIHLITTDQREGGRKLRQDMEEVGFTSDYYSVDRDRADYDTLHDLTLEERMLLADVPLTYIELTELIDHQNNGHKPVIDHPKHFMTLISEIGKVLATKDLSDAICGSINGVAKLKQIFNPIMLYTKHREQNPISSHKLLMKSHAMKDFSKKLGFR